MASVSFVSEYGGILFLQTILPRTSTVASLIFGYLRTASGWGPTSIKGYHSELIHKCRVFQKENHRCTLL